ncbi:MAG: response regulator [Lentisphaeraceae bacterium]|nr:response regulator [Lentisphaeraceae bacterium]
MCSIHRLRQVLLNLVSNAIKFTEKGKVSLSVKIIEDKANKQTLRFSIKDSGIGVSEEEKKRIFKAFMQADGSTTRKYGGTGLGLTISSQIVQAMGGAISVDSCIGLGSEFSFDLTLEKALCALPPKTLNQKIKVLIYEPDKICRDSLICTLRRQNCQILIAETFTEACQLISESEWFLVDGKSFKNNFLDWQDLFIQYGTKILLLYSSLPRSSTTDLLPDGQIFRLSYPVSPDALQNLFIFSQSASSPQTTEEQEPCKLRILMAEDNPLNQRFQRAILERMGHIVIIAENGREALSTLEAENFDLILMDVQMPVLSGIETTYCIRALGISIPIIGLTANNQDSVKQSCLDSGMNYFLSKPLIIDELSTIIRQTNQLRISKKSY